MLSLFLTVDKVPRPLTHNEKLMLFTGLCAGALIASLMMLGAVLWAAHRFGGLTLTALTS